MTNEQNNNLAYLNNLVAAKNAKIAELETQIAALQLAAKRAAEIDGVQLKSVEALPPTPGNTAAYQRDVELRHGKRD